MSSTLSSGRKYGLAALMALSVAAVSAQTPTPPSQGQPPTFSLAVTLVTTDVIVRDERDQFVADLTKDEFEVLEDGRPSFPAVAKVIAVGS